MITNGTIVVHNLEINFVGTDEYYAIVKRDGKVIAEGFYRTNDPEVLKYRCSELYLRDKGEAS